MGLISRAHVTETAVASLMSVLSKESEMSESSDKSVIETDKHAEAIAWLTAYAKRAQTDGATARDHLLDLFRGLGESAIAEGKGRDAKLIGVAATVAALHVGKWMPDAHRAEVVKAWQSDTRDGGKIGQTVIAFILGVAQSTVSADLRAGVQADPTPALTPAVKVSDAHASLKKALGKIDTPSQEVLDELAAIERLCREFRKGKTSNRA